MFSRSMADVQSKINRQALPPVGSTWRHYKGDLYIVKGHVVKESTEEVEVCYQAMIAPLSIPWSRPINEWNESVEYEGKSVPRFKMILQ